MAALRLGERLAVLLDESQLLLLVLRLGERLGALLDELLLCSMGEWRASPPARFFHSRLLPTSTSSPRLGGVGKPSEFHSPRSRSSPTCAQRCRHRRRVTREGGAARAHAMPHQGGRGAGEAQRGAAGRTSLRNWTGVFFEGTSSCEKRRECLSWLSGELGMETTKRSAASSSSERRDLPAERGRCHVSTSHCGRGHLHCVAQYAVAAPRMHCLHVLYLPWRCRAKLPASESALSDERSRPGAHSRFPSSRDSPE